LCAAADWHRFRIYGQAVLGAAAGTTAGASSSTISRSQFAQDVPAFTQSLFQALASNQGAPVRSGSNGDGSALGIAVPHGYGHGRARDGMRSKLKSLINTLNTSSSDTAAGTSSASASADVANLNSMFSKLMTDLGGASSTNAQSCSTTLPGLLESVLQHVQQQGSWAASVGNVVQVGA
jgi:hypothetical protein